MLLTILGIFQTSVIDLKILNKIQDKGDLIFTCNIQLLSKF